MPSDRTAGAPPGVRCVCPSCSLGCTLLLRPGEDAAYFGEGGAAALDYDAGGSPTRGALCAKGNMTLELLRHPRRPESPGLREDGDLRPASWEEALEAVAGALRALRDRHGPASIGILAGPHLTLEEAGLAAALARGLSCPNLDLCQAEDRPVLAGIEASPARPAAVSDLEQLRAMTAVLVVGDLFTLAPCLARPVLDARYDRRRNVLAVLDAVVTRTGWFAKPMLACRPGGETAALALLLREALGRPDLPDIAWGEPARRILEDLDPGALEEAAGLDAAALALPLRALGEETESGVLLAAGFGATVRADLAAGLAAMLAEATGSRFLPLFAGADTPGVRSELRGAGFPDPAGFTAPEMLEAAVTGDVKGLLVLGCDPVGNLPGSLARRAAGAVPFLAAAMPMPGPTADFASVLFPAKAWGEKGGTVRGALGGRQALGTALPPAGAARSEGEILEALLEGLGLEGPAERPAEREPPPRADASGLLPELDMFFREGRRGRGPSEAGTHLLLPQAVPPHTSDGWLTRPLSWPAHEVPRSLVSLAPDHARSLGVADGDRVLVRSREGRAALTVRVSRRVPRGTVLAQPHDPAVRGLVPWRLLPGIRDLDIRPVRVSVEPAGEGDDV